MKQRTHKFSLILAALLGTTATLADTAPPRTITAAEIITAQMSHLEYTHYKVTGICMWLKPGIVPRVTISLELDEYKPDLVVTVYNKNGDDPWWEAKEFIDSVSSALGSKILQKITGFMVTQGNNAEISGQMHYDNLRSKVVDVIGDPMDALAQPLADLRPDTQAFMPYYQSELDILGTLGIAEAIQPKTWEPTANPIGMGLMQHWSYEFPRSMTIDVDNDFKAAVVAALHAADIVTNTHELHTVQGTNNRCGLNCAVANVVEETSDTNEIWQEIYPEDRHIVLGQNDVFSLQSIGASNDIKGRGNYVFVVWRRYQGCVQHEGDLVLATKTISPTKKR